jgi:murein L,D-transpeptidase YcbB/YkuD
VSPDLAQKIIAPRVLKDGYSYLTERGYEVVSKFGADAQVLAPDKVDWEAVASGRMMREGPAEAGPGQFDGPTQVRPALSRGHLPS